MPFDPTLIFKWLDDLSLMGKALAPSANAWIEQQVELSKGAITQRKLDRRIRVCRGKCRRAKYGAEQIAMRVKLDFSEMSDTQIGEITSLIDFEVLGKK